MSLRCYLHSCITTILNRAHALNPVLSDSTRSGHKCGKHSHRNLTKHTIFHDMLRDNSPSRNIHPRAFRATLLGLYEAFFDSCRSLTLDLESYERCACALHMFQRSYLTGFSCSVWCQKQLQPTVFFSALFQLWRFWRWLLYLCIQRPTLLVTTE